MRLTISPPSCAQCHEIWEDEPTGTLWATPGLLRDSFTFTTKENLAGVSVTSLQKSCRYNSNNVVLIDIKNNNKQKYKSYK